MASEMRRALGASAANPALFCCESLLTAIGSGTAWKLSTRLLRLEGSSEVATAKVRTDAACEGRAGGQR